MPQRHRDTKIHKDQDIHSMPSVLLCVSASLRQKNMNESPTYHLNYRMSHHEGYVLIDFETHTILILTTDRTMNIFNLIIRKHQNDLGTSRPYAFTNSAGRKIIYIIMVPIILRFSFLDVFGAVKTWVGLTSGGSWSVGSNWSDGTIPVFSDDVLFNTGTSMVITGITGYEVNKLTVAKNGSVNTSINLQASVIAGRYININSGVGGDDLIIEQGCTLSTGVQGGGYPVKIFMAENSSGVIAGTYTINANSYSNSLNVYGYFTVSGTVNIGANTTNCIMNIQNAGSLTVTSTGVINNSGTFKNQHGTPVIINGTFVNNGIYQASTYSGNGTMIYGTFDAKSNPITYVTYSGAFTIKSGGTLITSHASGVNGILVQNTHTCETGSSFVFNGTSAQVTGSKMPANVTNLTVSTTGGSLSFSAATTISGNLSITAGSMANLYTYTHTANTLTLGGSGTMNGTHGSSSSPATYKNNTYFAATGGIVSVTTSTYPPLSFSYTANNITCSGANDGQITISATGGSGSGYQYRIYNGTGWIGWQGSNVFAALPPATYTIEVKDGNGVVQAECP